MGLGVLEGEEVGVGVEVSLLVPVVVTVDVIDEVGLDVGVLEAEAPGLAVVVVVGLLEIVDVGVGVPVDEADGVIEDVGDADGGNGVDEGDVPHPVDVILINRIRKTPRLLVP